jgi:hypothetical protein
MTGKAVATTSSIALRREPLAAASVFPHVNFLDLQT